MNTLAIVIPFYNEEKNLKPFLEQIEEKLNNELPLHFILINDGSADKSYSVVQDYKVKKANKKKLINLTRNFGHQQALMAGLYHVPKDVENILVIDADFQDDPSDIKLLLDKYKEGYDCVYAIRTANSGNWIINILTMMFYKLQKAMTILTIPQDAGTFSVFNQKVLEKILMFKEREIYFPAIRAYVGMKQTGVKLERKKRRQGDSKVGFRGLLNLSLVGIIGFSVAPMRFIFLFGIFMIVFCVAVAILVFFLKIFDITEIPGVTTTLISIYGLAGIQIMFMGMIGEYIGKLFIENKRRPLWLVSEIIDE